MSETKMTQEERSRYMSDLLEMGYYGVFSLENTLDEFKDDEYITSKIQNKIDEFWKAEEIRKNTCSVCGHQKVDGVCKNPDCMDDGLPF